MASQPQAGTTIAGLDLIRFAAALIVAWYHMAYWGWFFPNSTTAHVLAGAARFEPLAASARWGWVGVEIFFVLSGFVIAFTARSKSARSFLRSRFLRLYPAAWICAAVSAAVLAFYSVYPADDLIMRLISSWAIWPEGPWVDGVYWTLVVEIMFYLTVFLTLLIASFERLPAVLVVIGVLSSGFWFAALGGADLSWFWDLPYNWVLSLLPFGCFFALGGIMWLATTGPLSKWQLSVGVLALLAGAIEIRWVPVLSPETAGNPYVPVVVWLSAVALIAISAAKAESINRWLARFHGAIRLTGLATYPLYLLHNTVGPGLIRLFTGSGAGPYSALALAMCIVLGLSYAIAGLVEPAARKALARGLTRKRPTAIAAHDTGS